jgi:DnaJ-class molecular chaperone
MPYGVPYDPAIHCRTCRGWGTLRQIGVRKEEKCPLCHGSGMKRKSAYHQRTTLFSLQ